jgi:hypothetical protein
MEIDFLLSNLTQFSRCFKSELLNLNRAVEIILIDFMIELI